MFVMSFLKWEQQSQTCATVMQLVTQCTGLVPVLFSQGLEKITASKQLRTNDLTPYC